jgi:hypothetical protein
LWLLSGPLLCGVPAADDMARQPQTDSTEECTSSHTERAGSTPVHNSTGGRFCSYSHSCLPWSYHTRRGFCNNRGLSRSFDFNVTSMSASMAESPSMWSQTCGRGLHSHMWWFVCILQFHHRLKHPSPLWRWEDQTHCQYKLTSSSNHKPWEFDGVQWAPKLPFLPARASINVKLGFQFITIYVSVCTRHEAYIYI